MRNIPFSPPDITEEEIAEVADTLRSGWITTGPKTKKLEEEIAQLCGTKKAACLNSATASMEMILRILGIGEGDEVITTAYTYTASCSVICHVGATPVLVDTVKGTYDMDPEAVAAAITPKTKAIICVDLGGIVYPHYDRIFEIVEEKKASFTATSELQKKFERIIVLSDGAHAFGASRDGVMAGDIADFTSFSFHAVKNFTTAEGGAATWKEREDMDSEEIYKQFMLHSLHGQSKDALAKTQLGAWEYDVVAPYYKCNMTDIMAALGLAQMRRYPALLKRRRDIIERYDEAFAKLPVEVLKHFDDGADAKIPYTASGHLYMVSLTGRTREEANDVIVKMAERGVSCNVHYKPLPLLSAYKNMGFDIKDFPNAYEMFTEEITLPLHTCLTDEDVEYVIEQFTDVINHL